SLSVESPPQATNSVRNAIDKTTLAVLCIDEHSRQYMAILHCREQSMDPAHTMAPVRDYNAAARKIDRALM
ncbi:uncharacterized protein METZ01_LOCUS322105, partial [marine metagenome]